MKPDLRRIARELRRKFLYVRRADRQYMSKLIAVARQCIMLMRGYAPGGQLRDIEGLMEALRNYADLIEPWAVRVSTTMLEDVARRDARAWMEKSRRMALGLRAEIMSAPTGHVMQELIKAQVIEIRSIPLAAAERVYSLASEAHITGQRSIELAKRIVATEGVTIGRAKMIARSAVSTASTTLVEARAKYVGASQYIWHTSDDEDVRSDHRHLNGKVFDWENPPVVDKRSGYRSHPGCNANCRCWAEPILPERI